jgi:hypothetical protein
MKGSIRLASVLGAAATVALAIGCSKSATGPSDPFVGNWSVTIPRLIYNGSPVDTGTVTPSPFTLTISGTAPNYTAAWPQLDWNATVNGTPGPFPLPGSNTVIATLVASGDSLSVRIPWALGGTGCLFAITGVYSGRNASGVIDVGGGVCGTLGGSEAATGSWTATKQ